MDPITWIVIMYVSACLTVDPAAFESELAQKLPMCKELNQFQWARPLPAPQPPKELKK